MQTAMTSIDVFSLKLVREKTGLYMIDNSIVNSPTAAYELIQNVLDLESEPVEKFGIIALSTKNTVCGIHIISIGSLDAAIVHPREVFKAAILNNAARIICFHNHPSGFPEPSQEDIEITHRLRDCGEMLGITLMDHVIIGSAGKYVSLKLKGHL